MTVRMGRYGRWRPDGAERIGHGGDQKRVKAWSANFSKMPRGFLHLRPEADYPVCHAEQNNSQRMILTLPRYETSQPSPSWDNIVKNRAKIFS